LQRVCELANIELHPAVSSDLKSGKLQTILPTDIEIGLIEKGINQQYTTRYQIDQLKNKSPDQVNPFFFGFVL
jgi:hypothetical protein